jgi:hypothetical protein
VVFSFNIINYEKNIIPYFFTYISLF